MSPENSFIQELQRRNVVKVAAAYVVGAWIILQISDIVFPVLGFGDTGIGIILAVLVTGLPLVIAFAWFFELTPDGVVPTRRVNPNESISRLTGQRINSIIITLLSIALLFFMYQYFVPTTSEVTIETEASPPVPVAEPATQFVEPAVSIASEVDPDPSIAVMPFVNMSSDSENEYFSDGLSEELLNVLAQIDGLRVAGRTSSFFYKGKNIDLRTIGQELDVNNILEGSVRKSGNRVRITAQLISTHDGFHLWSNTFDRDLDDIFAVQDEISREVADALQLALLTDGVTLPESRPTTRPEVHDIFLQANQLLHDRRSDSILRSVDLYRLASRLDPEFAPAQIGLANAAMIAWNNHRTLKLDEANRIATEAFTRAEQLGYTGAEYWASKGLFYSHQLTLSPTSYESAIEAFERAIELNGNDANVLQWYANLLRLDGPPGAIAHEMDLMDQAFRIDPHNRVVQMNYYVSLIGSNEEARGFAGLHRMAEVDGYDGYYQYLLWLYMGRGRFPEAAEMIGKLDEDNRVRYFALARMAYDFGVEKALLPTLTSVPGANHAHATARHLAVSLRRNPAEIRTEANILLNQPDLEADGTFYTFPLIEFGEFQLAKNLLENAYPGLKVDEPGLHGLADSDRVEYLSVLALTGQRDRAQKFARTIISAEAPRPATGMPRGRRPSLVYAYLVLGETGKAMDELETLYAAGWRELRVSGLKSNLIAAPLWADPRYRDLETRIERDLEKMKPAVFAALSWVPAFALK